jgi:hypothetical protein
MTQLKSRVPSVKLKNGALASIDDIIAMGQMGVVELAGAEVLPGVTDDDIADIAALPLTIGDDAQDVMVGAFNIAKNKELLEYQDLEQFTDCPAIVVGSGPSLDTMIDKIKATYGQFIIIAAASATRKLLDHGITPHVIAPKERIKYPDWCFDGLPRSVAYAGLQVVPEHHLASDHKWCVGDAGPLSSWAGTYRHRAIGPTSGTHAITVAMDLTSGPIYLIGMDNCATHHAGFMGKDVKFDETVKCYDGEMRDSQWIYRIARANISHNSGRLIQLSPTAAVIQGVNLSTLGSGGKVNMPIIRKDRKHRYTEFTKLMRSLPDDWNMLWGITQSASKIADTRLEKIETNNRILFHMMLSPSVAQLSMERRLGASDDYVIRWYRDIARNMIDMLTGTITEMSNVASDYDL